MNKALRKVYVDLNYEGKKMLDEASSMQYRNNMLENVRDNSASRMNQLKMKFHSNIKFSHIEDEED